MVGGQHLASGVQQDSLGETPPPSPKKIVTRVLSLLSKLAAVCFDSLAPRFLHGGREAILSAAIFRELLIEKRNFANCRLTLAASGLVSSLPAFLQLVVTV